jgi:hypothetical protein
MENTEKNILEALSGTIKLESIPDPQECHDPTAWWFDPDCEEGEYKYVLYKYMT